MCKIIKTCFLASHWAIAALVVIAPVSAFAQVNVQTFTQATGATYQSTEQALLNRSPFDAPAAPWNVGLNYHYADHPLEEYDSSNTQRTRILVNGIHTLELNAGYLARGWAVGVETQIHEVSIPGQTSQAALGDSRVQGKVGVWESADGLTGFTLIPEVYLPSGNANNFVSNHSFGGAFRLSFEKDFAWIRAALNLGFRFYAQDAQFRDLDYRKQLPWSAAVFVPITESWGANLEFYQAVVIPRTALENPGELYAGAKLKVGLQGVAHLGVSIGQTDFDRSDDFRIHAGLQWSFGLTSEPAMQPVQ